jgi:TonB family protein
MRTLVFFILLFTTSLSVRSQNDSTIKCDPHPGFFVLEQMPGFVGGTEALMKYVNSLAVYTDKARADSISGTVYVSFIVENEGSITKARILRGLHKDLDSISLDIVRNMPKWIPGKNNGRSIEAPYNLPIKFVFNQKPGAKTPIPSAYWEKKGKKLFMKECSIGFKKGVSECYCWYNFILWNYNSLKLYDLDLKLMFEKFRCE